MTAGIMIPGHILHTKKHARRPVKLISSSLKERPTQSEAPRILLTAAYGVFLLNTINDSGV